MALRHCKECKQGEQSATCNLPPGKSEFLRQILPKKVNKLPSLP